MIAMVLLQCLQPAKYCAEYPVLNYELLLKSEQTGFSSVIIIPINSTKVSIMLVEFIRGGLESNQKHYYAVAAVTSFRTVTSHQDGNWTYLSK